MAKATVSPDAPPGPPAAVGSGEVALALSVLNRVFGRSNRRDFAMRLWDGTVVPPDPGLDCRFTLALKRPGALRRMLMPPNELALGEAYLDGDFELEGDILAAMRLSDAFEGLAMDVGDWLGLARQMMALPSGGARGQANGRAAAWRGRRRANIDGAEHSRERDRKAISYHYDVGNDFFKLFLDRRMIYSCAYFATGQEDLETAQEAKLDHTCRKLRLKPGERLLDIGCGWGALILHAAQRFGVEATGITLSRPQADLANSSIEEAGMTGRCRALVLDYRDVAGHGPFDKVVSVGMVEHVGMAKLPTYFESAWNALKPGGLFLNHGITAAGKDPAVSNVLDRFIFRRGAFIRKYVFPDGELVPVGDTLRIAERTGFEVRDVESLREHYALTLRHWVRRLEANREEALRQVDERTYRLWQLYMAGCSHAFTTARLSVHQALLSKPDGAGRSHLPWNRSDLYAR